MTLTASPFAFPKQQIVRSESYRRFVASHACFSCGMSGMSQCAHANEGKGMGMKVCDTRSFPLCSTCHADLDQSRGMTKEERRTQEAKWVERMQRMAREASRKEFA